MTLVRLYNNWQVTNGSLLEAYYKICINVQWTVKIIMVHIDGLAKGYENSIFYAI